MNNVPECEKKLETVYKYFSHHMRTNTAVIVAMLEAINEGLSDESMTEMVMEAGYLLDIFDRGMSVCFNHLFGKKESSEPEEIALAALSAHFVKSAVAKDGSCEAVINIPEGVKVRCEPFAFKCLLQIFMHETALAAGGGFCADFNKNTLELRPNGGFYETPPAFEVFKEILAVQGIETEYSKISITLRFPDESINS